MTQTVHIFRKARTTNSAATAFTAKIPTATALATSAANGIYDLLDRSLGIATASRVPKYIILQPFGTNGDGDTFDMRLWGWSETDVTTGLYIPQLLVQLNIVLSTASGAAIAADTYMADTITVAKGVADTTISTDNNTSASVRVDIKGCRFIEFDFDLAGAQEATGMNCWWRMQDEL